MTAAVSPTLQDLGWDPGWATAFLPFDAAGWRPARVVAAHRDAWVVATPWRRLRCGDRRPTAPRGARTGRPAGGRRLGRRRARRQRRDRRRVGRAACRACKWIRTHRDPGRAAAPDRVRPEHRRLRTPDRQPCRRRAGARRQRRHRAGRDQPRWRLQPPSSRAVPRRRVDRRGYPRDRAQQGRRRRRSRRAARRRRGRRARRRGAGDLGADRRRRRPPWPTTTCRRAGPPSCSVPRASASPRSSTRCWATSAFERPPSARTTRAAATPRPIASSSGCLRGALLIDTPGIRSLGVAGASDGLETAFADIADLAAGCKFRDCRHDGEPGCAVRAALDDGSLDPPGSRAIASWSARRPTSPASPTRSRWPPSDDAGRRSTPRWPSR